MNKSNRILLELAGFLLAVLLIFGALSLLIAPAPSEFAQKNLSNLTEKTLHYAALGDSLTEGVGDATGQGGFVPLFTKQLENKTGQTVSSANFGKAGDTSEQIYARMTSQTKIKTGLKEADIITITVGGNDVMKVVRDNLSNLSNLTVSDFDKPSQTYQKELRKIFQTIRASNTHAQIYLLGIYNPFYLNFPNVTALQDIIDNWNAATAEVVKSENKATFVPINDLLYKGSNGQTAVEVSSSASSDDNDLLYTGDHFHPNNIGYQIMANAVFKAYEAHHDN